MYQFFRRKTNLVLSKNLGILNKFLLYKQLCVLYPAKIWKSHVHITKYITAEVSPRLAQLNNIIPLPYNKM